MHCYHGADRTGLVVAMYRVIYQGWSFDAARSEMIDGRIQLSLDVAGYRGLFDAAKTKRS